MKTFLHTNAKSVKEAADVLSEGNAKVIAGGTDVLGTLKDDILPIYPKSVVNIKTIPGLSYIKDDNGTLKIGATTLISDLAADEFVRTKFAAVSQAAKAIASPHLRDMGTVGGNVTQLPRCWYFRKAGNRFNCSRKGGEECYAILGDNRYHSAFGGKRIHSSPCTGECPAKTDIPGYMQAIREGDWDKAASIILQVNPLPPVTARVCAHFCQTKCNRLKTDDGVLISGVERVLGEYILANSGKFYKAPAKETGKSVAIIGAGPSGLSAAFYLRKAGNKVVVYDRQPKAGGMLQYAIPAYRLPKDIVDDLVSKLGGMGIEFKLGVNLGSDVAPETLEKEYDAVLYATGTWKRPVLGISGEELTVFGLQFLTEVRKWFDDNAVAGKEVFVMGGGNVAMDVALSAKRLGAAKVTLACLEPRERMPASKEEIARAEEEGVIVNPGWGLSRVIERDGKAAAIELKRCTSPWDATGRFNPQYDESDLLVVESENLLMATGQQVDLSFLDEKYEIQLTARGLIEINDSSMTNREGVFATGDVTLGAGTVIRGIDKGHAAADGINRYLETTIVEEAVAPPEFLNSDKEGLKNLKQMEQRELSMELRALDKEDSISPTHAEAVAEASRCLNCGCYAISPSDLAPAFVALGAKIVTNKRTIDAEGFFAANTLASTNLEYDEIITEIQVPPLPAGAQSVFKKFAFRKAIDFPVVNAAIVTGDAPRVVLGAVAPVPVRAKKAEEALRGKKVDEAVATAVGEAAVAGADPFEATKYKLQIAKTIVKRALLSL
ncbi:MAG: FAD binding domain-containing protein [Oscillospiraceae bacterium]|jgi:NADPH-dependent glutamate synthase beta subunit-like oxidoreductase|nr:FAD binding domain-containing protein [Oscillospiraceae bacterium]